MVKPFKLERRFIVELARKLRSVNRTFLPDSKVSTLMPSKFLPTLSQLTDIIIHLFWASTQFEEGRPLRFRAAYSYPTGLEHLDICFGLRSLRPWTTEAIRRLAPAVAPPDGTMFVGSFYGKLYILGIGSSPSLGVEFEVIDPARLIVKFPFGQAVAEISGAGAGLIPEEWRTRISNVLSDFHTRSDADHHRRLLMQVLFRRMTAETLKRIRILRHGGTLIFVDHPTEWKKSAERHSVPTFSVVYNGIRHIVNGVVEQLEDTLGLGSDEVQVLRKAYSLISDYKISTFLANSARTLAYLSGVDGAVVVNNNYDLLGFGIKIAEKTKSSAKQRVKRIMPFEHLTEESFAEPLLAHEFKGKRHLSSARFVLNNPTCRSFTVSQDGGITCFLIEDGQLCAYSGIELSL
jgi:hypothetical protein